MPSLTALLSGPVRGLVPPTPMSRRLAVQSLLRSSGQGAFNTVSALFLLRVIGIAPGQVGLAITIALLARSLLAWPVGRLVDRIGPKRIWWWAALVQTVLFVGLPFVSTWMAYLLLAVVMEVAEAAAESANRAYVLDVLPAAERIQTQAHLYSALNIGFTVGALLGGIALAFDSTTIVRWVPLVAAVLMLANAIGVRMLPDAPHDVRAAEQAASRTKAARIPGPSAGRNVGWILTSALVSTMWTNQVLLNTVIPLWLVARTDAPPVLLAWLFGTNTVLCIFVPPYLARYGRTLKAALTSIWISTAFFIGSCLITMLTHETSGLWTIALVWLGHVTVTGAELAISGASWSIQAELMDPRRRGEYDGVANVARGLGSMWAPALFTWLAMDWDGGTGWLVIAGIILAAGAGLGPSVRMAERFAHRNFPQAPSPEPVATPSA
jgi:MFS family permease